MNRATLTAIRRHPARATNPATWLRIRRHRRQIDRIHDSMNQRIGATRAALDQLKADLVAAQEKHPDVPR